MPPPPPKRSAMQFYAQISRRISHCVFETTRAALSPSQWTSCAELARIGLNNRLIFMNKNKRVMLQICSDNQVTAYKDLEGIRGDILTKLPPSPASETIVDAELYSVAFHCSCGEFAWATPEIEPTAVQLPFEMLIELGNGCSHNKSYSTSVHCVQFIARFLCGTFQPKDKSRGILGKLHGGMLSDVTLRVGDRELRAHRCVLAAASEVFQAMFEGGRFVEATEGVVDMKDVRVEVMEAALRHTYGQELGDPVGDTLVELLVLSERYQLLELKALCEERLRRDVSLDVLYLLAVADSNRAQRLKESVVARIVSSPEIVKRDSAKEIQRSNPEAFLDLFMKICERRDTH